jgi:hypothetical protein
MLAAPAALMVLAGFAKPRSFLYLAPAVTLLVALWLDRELQGGRIGRALVAAALLMAANVAAIAHIDHNSRPFKRTLPSLIKPSWISSPPMRPGASWWCRPTRSFRGCSRTARSTAAPVFLNARNCFAAGAHYDSIVLIRGHSDRSANAVFMRRFADAAARLVAGRQKIATMPAGRDDDAAFKTRRAACRLTPQF